MQLFRYSFLSLAVIAFLVGTVFAESNTPKQANVTKPVVKEDNVALTVNGINILERDIQAEIGTQIKKFEEQSVGWRLEQAKFQLRKQAIEAATLLTLIDEQIKKEGIKVSDEEVERDIAAKVQQRGMTREQFEKMIIDQGTTIDRIRENTRKVLGFQKLVDEKILKADASGGSIDDQKKSELINKYVEALRANAIITYPEGKEPAAPKADETDWRIVSNGKSKFKVSVRKLSSLAPEDYEGISSCEQCLLSSKGEDLPKPMDEYTIIEVRWQIENLDPADIDFDAMENSGIVTTAKVLKNMGVDAENFRICLEQQGKQSQISTYRYQDSSPYKAIFFISRETLGLATTVRIKTNGEAFDLIPIEL